jgi:hypothetical protein
MLLRLCKKIIISSYNEAGEVLRADSLKPFESSAK